MVPRGLQMIQFRADPKNEKLIKMYIHTEKAKISFDVCCYLKVNEIKKVKQKQLE